MAHLAPGPGPAVVRRRAVALAAALLVGGVSVGAVALSRAGDGGSRADALQVTSAADAAELPFVAGSSAAPAATGSVSATPRAGSTGVGTAAAAAAGLARAGQRGDEAAPTGSTGEDDVPPVAPTEGAAPASTTPMTAPSPSAAGPTSPTAGPSREPAASPTATAPSPASPTTTPSPDRTAVVVATNSASEAARLVVNGSEVVVPAGTSRALTLTVRGEDRDTVFLGSAQRDCGSERSGDLGLRAGGHYEVEVVDSAQPTCRPDGALFPVTEPVFARPLPWEDVA